MDICGTDDNGFTSIDGVGDSCRNFLRPWFVIINPNRSANTPLPNITVCTAHSDAIVKKRRVEWPFCNIDWSSSSDLIQSVDLW